MPVVEGVERLRPLRLLAGVSRDKAGQQLPRLDLRLVAVLEHLDPLDRRARKSLSYHLVELLPYPIKLCLLHDRLTSGHVT